MKAMGKRGLPRSLIVVLLILAPVAAYHVFWPTYSRRTRMDPQQVFLAVVLPGRNRYEVHRDNAPRLLRRLIQAVNRGRTWVRIKQEFDGVMVVHCSGRPSILIGYPASQEHGAMLFTDDPRTAGSRAIYRSSSLARALRAVRASSKCRVRPPKIPSRSLSRVVLYAGGSHLAAPGSSPRATRPLRAISGFLASLDTSVYSLLGGPTYRSFYQGEVEPHRHLSQTTGALLLLDPPLSMHTTMMFWDRDSGPPAEYHEFKTNMILISDALSIKDSYSREPRRVVGFNSDAKPNRFYLFDADIPANDEEARETAAKWNNLIRTIQEAVAPPNP
jgi:hypothetical protein